MFENLHPGGSLAWDYIWQSTLLLGLGLAATAALARRPARAHRLLLLVMLAALVSPVLTQAVRSGGWGLLTPEKKSGSNVILSNAKPNTPPLATRTPLPTATMPMFDADEPARPARRIAELHAANVPDTTARPRELSSEPRALLIPMTWQTRVLGVWLALVCLAAIRLVTGMVLSVNVVRRARHLKNETLETAARTSAARLGVSQKPELRLSPRVRSPVIWCWGRRPVIALPQEVEMEAVAIDWIGVFCHELAHWVRHDHWSGLLAEVLVCALPWHPLAWWARQRLGQLSELACDDWVLATGLPAANYAETLLNLVPQRCGVLALAAVSSRRALACRIRHVLDERRRSPVVGLRWACATAASTVLTASVLALAQTRPAERKPDSKVDDGSMPPNISKRSVPGTAQAPRRGHVSGTVLGPQGKPIAGATVWRISFRDPPLDARALPKEQEAQSSHQADALGEIVTDASGTFSLSVEFDRDRHGHQEKASVVLLARAPGMGVLAHAVNAGATGVTLRMTPEVVIHGRLLTPSGIPAAGVRVTLDDFFNEEQTEGMGVGMTPTHGSVPRYWPKPRTTDADGRFTFDGLPRDAHVRLDFWPSEYAVDEVIVDTTTAPRVAGVLKNFFGALDDVRVKPTFTHTLEPARPVQGRVTDKQTGKPLAGMLVQLSSLRRRRGGEEKFFSRTDADGRYRISGCQAGSYRTTVFPPAGSAYLGSSHLQQSWPAGEKVIQKDFALDKGRIVRGRVIDAATKRSIASAAVGYQPRGNNPNNRKEYDFSNTVLTDTDGRFAIATPPGRGIIGVLTADEAYMHVSDEPLLHAQGVASIDVPKDGEARPVEIAVRKGAVLVAKVVGPDGNAIPEVVASCEGIAAMMLFHAWEPAVHGVFRLAGVDPAKTYRIFFIQPDRQLGAVVDLKPGTNSQQPVVVTLQPTAKVHGKLVATNGSPADGAEVHPMIAKGNQKEREMTRMEIMSDTEFYANLMGQEAMMSYVMTIRRPRPKGEFVIDTLVPGASFYIMAGLGRREAYVSVPPLRSGEERDLGTITLKERQP